MVRTVVWDDALSVNEFVVLHWQVEGKLEVGHTSEGFLLNRKRRRQDTKRVAHSGSCSRVAGTPLSRKAFHLKRQEGV